MRNPAEISEIMEIFNRRDPNPQCELNFHNAYTLLVAVVLSAQSTDKGVNRATEKLFKIADTAQKMLDLGIGELKEYIKTIGLYNNKAKNIISLSKDIVEKFGGDRSRATAWRGYNAVGGELLILGLPMYIHSVLPTLRDWARDIREAPA